VPTLRVHATPVTDLVLVVVVVNEPARIKDVRFDLKNVQTPGGWQCPLSYFDSDSDPDSDSDYKLQVFRSNKRKVKTPHPSTQTHFYTLYPHKNYTVNRIFQAVLAKI